MHVVAWGTYDLGKPRVRILLRGLRENGVKVTEVHHDVWTAIEDKSQIKGSWRKTRYLFKCLAGYPSLIWRYLWAPSHDVAMVFYLGHLDVLILWPFARLKRTPIVWDAFLSLYNTVVEDREFLGRRHPLSYLLWVGEWMACRAASKVVLDTATHARYFVDRYQVSPKKVDHVLVGAEPETFYPLLSESRQADKNTVSTVLFYGQFIPLHGIETVIKAACLAQAASTRWVIIGRGQEARRAKELIQELAPDNLRWLAWVPYVELVQWIHKADVCLGIFGTTAKAAMVIPNKVFQVLAAGRSLVTRDSPAIRELLSERSQAIILVPPGDEHALAAAVCALVERRTKLHNQLLHEDLRKRIMPAVLGSELLEILECQPRSP